MSGLPSVYTDLTGKQRIYVDSRMAGLGKVASAAAAGASNPKSECTRFENNENVQAALIAMMERNAEEVGFGRKEAHDMYMDAYLNSETAMEQIAAVNALVKLHGLEKPKQVEVQHTHTGNVDMRYLPTDELMKLADMKSDLVLEGEFEEVGKRPELEPPEVTDDNSESEETLPNSPEDY